MLTLPNTQTREPAAIEYAAPHLAAATPVRLVRAGHALWRVLDARGRVIGHLQVIEHELGIRYRARRFHMPTGRFRDLGDFWSGDDAVSCLRHAG